MKKSYLIILLASLVILAVFFFARKKTTFPLPDSGEKAQPSAAVSLRTLSASMVFFTDLENPDPAIWVGEKNSEEHFSGSFSNKLSPEMVYGITLIKNVNELTNREKIREVKISFQVKSPKSLAKASLVYAVTGADGTVAEYYQQPIVSVAAKWTPAEYTFPVDPGKWTSNSTIKVYPWNEGKETFYIDDIKIEFLIETERSTGMELGPLQNFSFDYEPVPGTEPSSMLSREVAHSGSYSLMLDGADTYSETVTKKFSDVATDTVKFISTSVWIYPKENNPVVTLVVSIEKPDGTSISWQGKATDRMNLTKNEWHKINFRADLRELSITPGDLVKIYTWNKKGGTVFVDDLEIVYGDVPIPSGDAPGVKMDMSGNPLTIPGRNTPPFPEATLAAIPGIANASVYLIDNGTAASGELRPDETLLAGNYSGTKNTPDFLLTVKGSRWSLYGYCSKENRFANVFETSTGPDVKGKILCSGYFDDPGTEEVLILDSAVRAKGWIVRLSHLTDPCEQKSEGSMQTREVNFPESLAAIDWLFTTSGNFIGDGRTELVLFGRTGNQGHILSLKGNQWEPTSTLTLPDGKLAGVHRMKTENGHDKIILFSENDRKLDYYLMEFNTAGNKGSVRLLKDKSFLPYFGEHAELYSGRFGKTGSMEYVYLNQDWRFDLKQIRFGTNGLIVESQINFHQPDVNRNPRFYEFTKILSGKFFERDRDVFLVVMSNCKDESFDGRSCGEFEEVKDLPSGYQFYRFNVIK